MPEISRYGLCVSLRDQKVGWQFFDDPLEAAGAAHSEFDREEVLFVILMHFDPLGLRRLLYFDKRKIA
jgi:hypothetical protein